MFLNLGAMDQVTPREISGAIYRTVNLPPGTLGKIEIFEKCSYVGVPPEFVDQVMDMISQTNFNGRQLRMDVADQQDFSASRGPRGGPPRQGGPPPRGPRAAKLNFGREVGGEDWE
jgi:ATP-dependent RNA helicase DeaD